ncbi:hypothetical protein AGLY_009197 [Aphis glycines]|uniref:Uncharacterized protein n=1 Tax=Aphis glycines TaxID=307491 RepID=A0A6G0TIK8_APHGL|nr:hypothetical protein AGLY_009197 [Aphis glycines]
MDISTQNNCSPITPIDECIDFTMMYVFFVSVYSIISRNNASISNFGGGFQWKSEYPWCIIQFSKKSRKTKKKMTEKLEFLRKTSFRPNRFFYMVVIQKLITTTEKNFYTNFFFEVSHLKFKFRQKFVKIMNICKLFCSSKFIKLFVFISNVKYSILTNHLRSESYGFLSLKYQYKVYSFSKYPTYELQTLELKWLKLQKATFK